MQNLPSTAEIRQFLTEAFSNDDLATLCFDFFPQVSDDFSAGMTKRQKVQLLIEYCQRHTAMPNLLAALEKERATQFRERFPQSPRAGVGPAPAAIARDPRQVFISHAHEDAEFAHRLAGDLGKNGWRVWIAPESIRPGEKWAEAIERGLSESGAFVVALTPDAVRSRWVRDETFVAIELEKKGQVRFVPLAVESGDVPYLWGAYQRIPFEGDYGRGLTALLDVLKPERRAQREREAQEKAARERAEQLEREIEARRLAAQAEAERQTWLAAEKAAAERRELERLQREQATREAAERQTREKAEAERLERERQAREAAQAQRKTQTKPSLPGWALPAAGVALLVVVAVITCLVGSTIANNAANSAATQTAIAAWPTLLQIVPVATTPRAAPATATSAPSVATATLIPTPRIATSDGMVTVYVWAGKFTMGSTDSDKNADSDEKPSHEVNLDAFWIDRTEVTNAQYKQCVQDQKCKASSFANDSKFNGDNQPVVGVDWNDAKMYCEWAGRRLPTKAEWEKAARGMDGRIYPWGNNAITGKLANFCDKNCEYGQKDSTIDDGYAYTAPVGKYPAGASPYSAFDMAGNVWEWVADWYVEKYYDSSAATSPNPQGPASGQYRVVRGGSWNDTAQNSRSAYRLKYSPQSRHKDLGFRCSR